MAKDYFKTWIWESVELPNSLLEEVKIYIDKKLTFHNFHQYYFMFKDEHLELIYKLTNGKLRNINKLLYTFFELCEYYDAKIQLSFQI